MGMRVGEVEKKIKEDRPRAFIIVENSLRYLCGVLDTPAIPQAQRPPLNVNVDEFENDGFIVNDLMTMKRTCQISMMRSKRREGRRVDKAARCFKLIVRAKEPVIQAPAAEAEPKKEVAPKPPPIKPKREELRIKEIYVNLQGDKKCSYSLQNISKLHLEGKFTEITELWTMLHETDKFRVFIHPNYNRGELSELESSDNYIVVIERTTA
ncbi:hypothetical protein Tco_1507928 [Tanacetum coccineum]